MKERYVKVFTGFCWVIVAVVVITVAFFWFRILSGQSESGVSVVVEDVRAIEMQELQYEYWSTKTGSKYYPLTCASAPDIAEDRKMYYASPEEAVRYGKELSVRCQ